MSTGIADLGNTSNPSGLSSSGMGKEPSQLRGHTKYAKGVVNETIGQTTNSPGWQESGATAKAQGIAEMRAAKQMEDPELRREYPQRDPIALKTEGKTQGVLGKALGVLGDGVEG